MTGKTLCINCLVSVPYLRSPLTIGMISVGVQGATRNENKIAVKKTTSGCFGSGVFCYSNEENEHCDCTNGHWTTANGAIGK